MEMHIKYIGEKSNPLALLTGKIYKCLGEEYDMYRVIDETDEDYLYPKDEFEIMRVISPEGCNI